MDLYREPEPDDGPAEPEPVYNPELNPPTDPTPEPADGPADPNPALGPIPEPAVGLAPPDPEEPYQDPEPELKPEDRFATLTDGYAAPEAAPDPVAVG